METRALIIKGAHLIDSAAGIDASCDIRVENGFVAGIGGGFTAGGERIIRADGLVAAPGLVDMHVHLRDPGQTRKEDIFSGCSAAAAGGVTSLAAMPNTAPVADNPDIIGYEVVKSSQAPVNVYPIAAATVGQLGKELTDFETLVRAGAAAFSDDGKPIESAAVMASAMRAAARAGKPLISHCEDRTLAWGGVVNEGAVSRKLRVRGIPAAAEEVQVAREAALAASLGVPVHIAHVSTKGSVALIRDAKKRGVRITCETCPHYFGLDESRALSRDADYRMNPPLRTKDDVNAIIEGLRDGTIDAIVTDHAPHTAYDKRSFLTAPNGVVGLETSLAAGITFLVRPGCLSLSKLLAKMSRSPARILGINAGTLRTGSPADIVLFDPNEKWRVDPQALHSKGRNTPFKGMYLYGRVKYTICAGRIVFEDGMSR